MYCRVEAHATKTYGEKFTVKQLLRSIHELYAPDIVIRQTNTVFKYTSVLNEARLGRTDAISWIEKWEEVYYLAEKYEIVNIQDTTALIDFLNAIKVNLSPAWAEARTEKPMRAIKKGKIRNIPSLLDLASEYRTYLKLGRSEDPGPPLFSSTGYESGYSQCTENSLHWGYCSLDTCLSATKISTMSPQPYASPRLDLKSTSWDPWYRHIRNIARSQGIWDLGALAYRMSRMTKILKQRNQPLRAF